MPIKNLRDPQDHGLCASLSDLFQTPSLGENPPPLLIYSVFLPVGKAYTLHLLMQNNADSL